MAFQPLVWHKRRVFRKNFWAPTKIYWRVLDLSYAVFNLPDKLPPLHSSGTSERLLNIKRRRLERHEKVVAEFNATMASDIARYGAKLEELTGILHRHINDNHSQAGSLISSLDDEDFLLAKDEGEVNAIWEQCKAKNQNTLKQIETYKRFEHILFYDKTLSLFALHHINLNIWF